MHKPKGRGVLVQKPKGRRKESVHKPIGGGGVSLQKCKGGRWRVRRQCTDLEMVGWGGGGVGGKILVHKLKGSWGMGEIKASMHKACGRGGTEQSVSAQSMGVVVVVGGRGGGSSSYSAQT